MSGEYKIYDVRIVYEPVRNRGFLVLQYWLGSISKGSSDVSRPNERGNGGGGQNSEEENLERPTTPLDCHVQRFVQNTI